VQENHHENLRNVPCIACKTNTLRRFGVAQE
jgi:hypothetical protein